MSKRYIFKRIFVFMVTVVLAVTINFVIARITPADPIAALIGQMSSRGTQFEDGDELVERYTEQFGLNDSLPVQYVKYLGNLLRGDFGYSITYYPAKVTDVILSGIPRTIALLSVANIIAFIVGNLMGALSAWDRSPRWVKWSVYLLMPVSVIPYYMLAMILLYLFAIIWPIFPLGGITTAGSVGGTTWTSFVDIISHAILPIASSAISLIGFWALSMRGSMVSEFSGPYLNYARARGLKPTRVFWYATQNALLPQVTSLASNLGRVISGSILVEVIFSYPGVGQVLYTSIRNADYFVIQGIVLFIVISVALCNLIMDLLYPKIDPRISYE